MASVFLLIKRQQSAFFRFAYITQYWHKAKGLSRRISLSVSYPFGLFSLSIFQGFVYLYMLRSLFKVDSQERMQPGCNQQISDNHICSKRAAWTVQ